MNKPKIVKELDNYVKTIDSNFSVDGSDGDLNLNDDGECIIYFSNFNKNGFCISESDCELAKKAAKTGIINKFYLKAIELMGEYDKYTVSLSKDSAINYLNVDKTTRGFFFSTDNDSGKVQAYFTKTEIENMKNDPRFKAINFDKAIIEEVNC